MRNIYYHFIIVFLCINYNYSQNTIGIISNTAEAFNGYTLFTARTETYLIDNCGQVVNQWTSQYPPGVSVYLLENGNLLRAAKIPNEYISFGGTAGRVEMFDWDGALIWEYEYNTSEVRQHHDVYPMPNGNILMLAVSKIHYPDAIQSGRDPAKLKDSDGNELPLYNEHILELKPDFDTGNTSIVWEWHIKDHIIQDFDSTKDNFGVVENQPELLDINYLGETVVNSNWLHFNSIQYYSNLDQIVISSRLMSEIYIIDHSTTTEESASHNGGKYGKGGDFLYRWGNPQVYRHGTSENRKLFGQHYPHFISDGLLDAGKIILFNNGNGRIPEFSEVFILSPPTISSGVYLYDSGIPYGPSSPDFIYKNPIDPTIFYSSILSGAQRLPNDNILICEGKFGRIFEIDTSGNIVWEYLNPSSSTNGILNQGDDPSIESRSLFRAQRYSPLYEAFNSKTLTPKGTIETGQDMSDCQLALSLNESKLQDVFLFPNPVTHSLKIRSNMEINKIEVYDVLGKLIERNNDNNIKSLDLSTLKAGIYILKIYNENNILFIKKIIKM